MNISKLIRSDGITDYCVIPRDGNTVTVQGPITPQTLETALTLMARHSPTLRKAISRAMAHVSNEKISK